MMRVWHTTLLGNLPSIMRQGLLTSKSTGKLKAVWLHRVDLRSWAFLHVVKRHRADVHDVVSLEIDVPDECVKASSSPGLYYVRCDIPPEQILGVVGFSVVSRSPLEGRKAKQNG
jgi:hypothetical protein